ncbi:MAG: hypothetical protein IPG24_12865 [Leptospiraceae bacterium]|nr:hypothetical protein [Leptospiraceae bacterium]
MKYNIMIMVVFFLLTCADTNLNVKDSETSTTTENKVVINELDETPNFFDDFSGVTQDFLFAGKYITPVKTHQLNKLNLVKTNISICYSFAFEKINESHLRITSLLHNDARGKKCSNISKDNKEKLHELYKMDLIISKISEGKYGATVYDIQFNDSLLQHYLKIINLDRSYLIDSLKEDFSILEIFNYYNHIDGFIVFPLLMDGFKKKYRFRSFLNTINFTFLIKKEKGKLTISDIKTSSFFLAIYNDIISEENIELKQFKN